MVNRVSNQIPKHDHIYLKIEDNPELFPHGILAGYFFHGFVT